MSLRTVVADDLLDVRRSRLGWGVAAMVFALSAGVGILVLLTNTLNPEVDPPEFDLIMLIVGSVFSFMLPFIAMMASYNTIIHERESGSIRFLLGLPNSRLDAYAGKYVSRSVVVVASTLLGFAVLGLVGFTVLQEPDVVEFVLFLLVTLLFGLVFVGFGLFASAVLDSETSVTAGILSVYVLFRGGWMILQWGGLYLTRPPGEVGARPYPEWYYFLGRVNPINAYVRLFDEFFNEGRQILLTNPSPSVDSVAIGPWYALFGLLLWLVVVPVAGYLLFERRDVL